MRAYGHDDQSYADDVFWPEAMLPAWLIADRNLMVFGKRNDLARELISNAALLPDGTSAGLITLEPGPDQSQKDRKRSLWSNLFTEEACVHTDSGMRLVKEHFEILRQFESNKNIDPDALVAKLSAVKSIDKTVTPYISSPNARSDSLQVNRRPPLLQIGIRISPPEGLRLKHRLSNQDGTSAIQFMDVVIAYRVRLKWNEGRITKLSLHGLQPAFHDATQRNALWQTGLYYRISGLLAHSFKAPLCNAISFAESLTSSIETDQQVAIRDAIAVAESMKDMMGLVKLLGFINQIPEVKIHVHRYVDNGNTFEDTAFRIGAIIDCVASALLSIVNGRLDEAMSITIARRRIDSLFAAAGLPPPLFGTLDLNPYRELARSITTLSGVSQTDSIQVIVHQDNPGSLGYDKMQITTKHLLLNVMVNELIVNAIKHLGTSSPRVRVGISFDDRSGLDIDVFNTGRPMTRAYFEDIDDVVTSQTGNKRTPLGLILNKRAAGNLGIRFQWREPLLTGTRLGISVPPIGGHA